VLTSDRPADDLVRLASVYDADLLLVHPPADLDTESLPPELIGVLERSPVDVGIVAGTRLRADGAGVFVPFVGGEHDWAALELGAWLASSTDTPLTLIGSTVEGDGSRLLADASLAVQRAIGVPTEPALAEPGQDGLLAAVHGASIVVVGVSERWRERGLGPARRALVRSGSVPALLVHHGPRPGGLAPSEARTRFTWTVQNPY
jgi:hypothetical protein